MPNSPPFFWAGLSLWGGGVEVVQRKLGPISRGGEFSRPFFYFFSNFRENSLISGPFLLIISRPLSPAASPRTGRHRRSCGGSLSNSWGCRTYDGLPQKCFRKTYFYTTRKIPRVCITYNGFPFPTQKPQKKVNTFILYSKTIVRM